MTDPALVTLASPHDFAATVARLEAAVDARRLTVFARIDHAVGARAAGLALRPTLVLIFGDARGGTPLMQSTPTAGLDLPLRMLVWEDEAGAVRLAWREPAGAADLAAALAAIARSVAGGEALPTALAGAAAVHDRGRGHVQAQVATGGQAFFTDEPAALGGGDAGPSPHDLLAAALAACTAMTLRLYADRKGWPLERVHVAVDHRREAEASPPDRFERAVALTGPLDAEQTRRLLEIADRCPVHRTLTAGARIGARG